MDDGNDRDCILVAEDDENIRRMLVFSLEREGYRVCEAANGRQALDSMHGGDTNLLVLDLMMPQVSGWDVLAERSRDPDLAKIPVIIITANRGDQVAQVLDAGICALLPKPFELDALHALIRTCLSHSHD